MAIVGVIVFLVGLGGGILLITDAVPSLTPMLYKMPLGLAGWGIVMVAGLVMYFLFRRPND